jgi:hypothetical protein
VLATLGIDASAANGDASGTSGAPAPPTVLNQFLWLRSKVDGWWQPAVSPGDWSRRPASRHGQHLDGGEVVQSIHAPSAGVPMFITSS